MLLAVSLLTFAAAAGIAPLILRQWALRRAQQDPVAASFGLALRLNWIGLATLIALPCAVVFRGQFWGLFQGQVAEPFASLLRFMICTLPAAAMRVTGTLVGHDLSRRLRGVETPRRVAVELALLQGCSFLLALPLVCAGIAAFKAWGFEGGLLLMLSAVAIAAVALVRSQKIQGFTLHAVTSGELRDRVFALAARANVRLDQVFALPLSKWKHANAFAMNERRVMVTDYLLEHLDRDEVDAVMAHEIAHIAGKDPERQGWLLAFMVAIPTVAAMYGVNPMFTMAWVLITALVTLGYSRRCEYGADARAITLGVAPQSMITGLAKLNRLGLVPIDYPPLVEWWITHPSTKRRAHAIAKRANLPAEEVDTLLQPGAALQTPIIQLAPHSERYVPPDLEPGAKKFSTTFKQVTILRISLLAMLVAVATSLAVVNAARFLGVWGWTRFALWPVGILLVAGAVLSLLDWLACAQYRAVAKAVADRLTKALPNGLKDGISVGLAPHAEPRVYEGFSVWDVGLVTLHGRLDYRGEETRFSLTRDEVTEVSLVRGQPGWIKTQRVLVSWRRADGTSGVFTFGPTAARLSAVKREAWKLYSRIRQWRSPNPGTVIEAPIGPTLGPPPTGEVTSGAPGADITPKSLFNLALYYFFLTSLFGALVRMPHGIGPWTGIFDGIVMVFLGHLLLLAPLMRVKGGIAQQIARKPDRQAA